MQKGLWRSLLLVSLGASALTVSAQSRSFAGKWTLNMAKSQLTGQTITIEKTVSGTMHFASEGFAYDFDLAGKEYPTPDGGTAAFREVDPNTWDATMRMNGKVVGTYHITLKGDTQTTVFRVIKPDGGVLEETTTFSRVSGGPGFLGKWKSTQTKGAPPSMEITIEGANGITISYPELQVVCKASFDGKEHPVMQAGAVSKQTWVLQKTGANSFKIDQRLSGRPVYVDVFTLSADGTILTDDGNPVSGNEPTKTVYERK